MLKEFTEEEFADGFYACPLMSIGRDKPVCCLKEECALYMSWPSQELNGCTLYTSAEQSVRLHSVLSDIATNTSFITDICG